MQFGKLAGNSRINDTIYECFDCIHETDIQRFTNKFRRVRKDEQQALHTFRELVVGAYLCSNGFEARYEHCIDGKTPDWSLFENETVNSIVELVNFHTDRLKEKEIESTLRNEPTWCGWMDSNVKRPYSSLSDKAAVYKRFVSEHQIGYVVSIYGDFFADVEPDELQECLQGESGLFECYPEVGGVLSFEEQAGAYIFEYYVNSASTSPILLPSGSLGWRGGDV